MKPVLTAGEHRRLDEAHAGSLKEAMERAGHAVALAAARAGAGYGKVVVVLTGPGNNGGDGYVAARLLKSRGAYVEVQAQAPPKTDEARMAAAAARDAGILIRDLGSPVDADVVIDAIFGGGARGALPDQVLAWMSTQARVVAVDVPTGLDPDTGVVEQRAFHAWETVTFGTLKTGHVRGEGPDHCGTVTIADVGISGGEPSMFVAELEDAPRPPRERQAHKWSAGSVLVVGGSTGMTGAAVLAGKAALGFGAGTVVVSSPVFGDVQRSAPELLAYTLEQAVESLSRFDVVVAGPGLAPSDEETVRPILEKARRVVLDAGALTSESVAAARDGDSEVVITPHDAEFHRVVGVGAGAFSIRSYALSSGVIVLRKGNPTMVTDGGPPVLVDTGGPELATIGTGDVLAGMIAALWSRGLDATTAAVSGAYWHGVAGASLAREGTVTALALVERITAYAW